MQPICGLDLWCKRSFVGSHGCIEGNIMLKCRAVQDRYTAGPREVQTNASHGECLVRWCIFMGGRDNKFQPYSNVLLHQLPFSLSTRPVRRPPRAVLPGNYTSESVWQHLLFGCWVVWVPMSVGVGKMAAAASSVPL